LGLRCLEGALSHKKKYALNFRSLVLIPLGCDSCSFHQFLIGPCKSSSKKGIISGKSLDVFSQSRIHYQRHIRRDKSNLSQFHTSIIPFQQILKVSIRKGIYRGGDKGTDCGADSKQLRVRFFRHSLGIPKSVTCLPSPCTPQSATHSSSFKFLVVPK
jgi:hypothetical protein